MRGQRFERELADMEAGPTSEMATKHKGLIVGIKTAHYMGPDFAAVDRAVEAGKLAGIPVMVDFGRVSSQKTLAELLTKKLRPGDIYTHVYSGLRGELDPGGHANPGLFEGRKRGVIFDVGHGSGSFTSSLKDMLNVMSKFLALGLPLEEVILRSTWNPASEIKQEQLGHLSVGSPADVAVLRLETGDYGFLDMYGARLPGTQRLTCEMTLRDGRIAYELNGLARPRWDTLPKSYRATGDVRWEWNRDLGQGRTSTNPSPVAPQKMGLESPLNRPHSSPPL
jgi:dihydroorotase